MGAVLLWPGCESFDQTLDQPITEVRVPGDSAAFARGDRLQEDLIPPQSWDVLLPGVPAGIFVEGLSLTITATDGSDDTFGFLERIRFFVEPTAPASSLTRQLLAWSDAIPDAATFDLHTVRALDLTPYVVGGFRVVAEVQGRVPPDPVSFAGVATVLADAL